MLPRPGRLIALAVSFTAAVSIGTASGAEPALNRYDRVEVAPTKTSIYIGWVTMTMPAFVRVGGTFETSYTAKVFPYFFSNESGRLTIDMSDDMLRALDRGEGIEFKGRGISAANDERRVEGKVTPTSTTEGKIKVRVFVSKRIELIFNTTYRLNSAAPSPTGSEAGKSSK